MPSPLFQIRPQGSTDPMAAYAPTRDLANCGPVLFRAVIKSLGSDRRPPWVGDLVQRGLVTDEQIAHAAVAYARGTRDACDNPDATPNEALRAAGFFDCDPIAQLVLHARFGTSTLGLMIDGIKQVSTLGEASPQQQTVAAVVEAAEAIARQVA